MGDERFRLSGLIDLLHRCERKYDENGHEVIDPGIRDLRDAIETLVLRKGKDSPDAAVLGKKLGSFRGRIVAGLRLTSKSVDGTISAQGLRS